MNVKELIKELEKQNPEDEVLGYSEEEELLAPKHGFRLLYIESVDTLEGEPVRGSDDIPSMKIGRGENAKRFVTLNVVGTF